MGYELHITRADFSWESEKTPIPLAEWLEFAGKSPALTECGWIDWDDLGRVPVYAFICADGAEVSLRWIKRAEK